MLSSDFDEDAFIGIDDIIEVIKRLIGDNCSAMLKEFSEERKKDKESIKKDPQQKVDEELKQVAESVRCFSTHQLKDPELF